MDFHVGQTFGDYSITGVLGAGAMGQLYKVEHRLTKRTEAMKVLAAESATEIQIKRFQREMRVLARLNHPSIALLHNALHAEMQLIMFTEFVDGRTLESLLSAGRLPIDMGIGYIKQILSALGYAHQQGVVHRDVTPANVIVTDGGEVKLTDFGLSKSFGDPLLTNCGEILGSLPYLAPEQVKGVTQPDRRSDLYSVGAVLYEHLTGQKPFGAHRRLAPVLTDSEPDPQPPSQLEPSLAPQWDEIIRRALDRNPEHRYQSAEEFLASIAQFDEAAVAELPLPQLRTMGIGVAILAGLVVALAASPEFKSLRPVAPIPAPLEWLHIVPPDFATSIPPPPAKRVVHSVQRRAEPVAPQPPAQPKRSFWSKLNVFKKNDEKQ
jgi:serine/threonine protein kinase